LRQNKKMWRGALCAVASTAILSVSAAAGPRFDITNFAVHGNTLLPATEVDAILAAYAGRGRDFAAVQAAVAALQAAYQKRGFNLVRVDLPEQELDHGVVKLEVVETRIGRVTVEGNRYFDSANIRASVPGLVEGGKPNIGRISTSLAQANENPAKRTTLSLAAAAEGTVDAHLSVVDERPWHVSLTADDTGNAETGKTYTGVVYQNSNLWGLDHVASVQYTTSAEKPQRVSVYGAGYHIPFYALGDSMDFYASHSDVDSGSVLVGNFDLKLSGRGTVAGARYNHAFSRRGELQSAAGLGFEHKAYENDAVLLGFQLGGDVTVHPLTLSYTGTWTGSVGDLAFSLAAVHTIPGGEHGSDRDFALARAGARPAYTLARYGLSYSKVLPAQWRARLGVLGQYSRDELIPGEQFGAGGVGSVRGFENRDVAGDSGINGTAEIYTPDLCGGRARAYCNALAFYDAARVTRNDAFAGEAAHASIASVGLGLRTALGRNVTLLLDYGYVVDAGIGARRGDDKLNFRLSLTY
jgi:hemolysin activation/secretion protein